jgi:hypothetical protein
MKLDSFRDLLVKKSRDVSQQNLVKFMKDDLLAELVAESLEKMARASHKGDAANFAIRDFGTEMDPSHEPNMIHDALSHHASNYKAALNNGNKSVANQHAKQIYRIMDMADQAQKHSHGKLQVEAVSPHAWERNSKTNQYTADDDKVKDGSYKVGEFKTKTKGWRHRGNDCGFLQQAPHASYSQEIRRHGHDNAYPMEHMKVNGKHLDVEDVEAPNSYQPHPFDSHPVMKHFEESAGSRTPDRDKEYLAERDKYATSPELDKYFSNQEAREKANPDAAKQRGTMKSNAVHKQVDPLDTSKQQAQSSQQPTKPASPAVVKRPAKTELSPEERAKAISLLPPDLRAKLGLE